MKSLVAATLRARVPPRVPTAPRVAGAAPPWLVQRRTARTGRPPKTARPAQPAPDAPRLPIPAITLRDYQEDCIQAVLSSIEKGHKRLGVSLATGSGKTVIFTQLIGRVNPQSKTATQTLILAHRRELVEQAARHCSNTYPDQIIELELGKLSATGNADITVASLQSILSRDRYLKFDPSRFKLVLVDEAHHIVAPGYLKVLEHFGLRQKQDRSPNLVGVSATFSRFDGLKLGAVIDEIVYHKDYVDMIGDKWLSDVVFTTVESTADLSQVRRKGKGGSGEFDTESLSQAVNTVEINDILIRSWFAKAQGRKSTLVFCVDLNHIDSLTKRFRHYGVDARFVTGETPTRERAERLDDFKSGKFPVLINCGVFTEGTDIPNIDCVVLARPTRSRNLLIQMIGRGMRLHSGKENCHIIDMVASLETGIVTTPTLFGLDPGELVSGASADDMYELAEQRKQEAEERAREARAAREALEAREAQHILEARDALEDQVRVDTAGSKSAGPSYKVTFTEYASVFDLIADTSGERHIRSISQHAWVQVSPGKFILSGPGGTYMRLEETGRTGPDEPKWRAFEVRALPPGLLKYSSPYAAPRQLLEATTFPDAVHGCDSYASEHYPSHITLTRLSWRRAPATEGQLKMLNKMRSAEDELGPHDVTKGKAADMITKIKHGARGRFANIEAMKKRRAKSAAADELHKARRLGERVSVGPLAA